MLKNISAIFHKIKVSFVKELETEGDFWRLLRRQTIVDLIKLHYAKFQKTREEEELIQIVNLAFKVKVLHYLNKLKPANSLTETFHLFNKENNTILGAYEYVLQGIKLNVGNYSLNDYYDLNDEISYLKILNQIEKADYSDEVLENLIYTVINILNHDY